MTRPGDLKRIRGALEGADLVLIGASNGLDMAEGLNIFAPDAHFLEAYGDLAEATGARSILEGMYLSRGDVGRSWAWGARFARREWLGYEKSVIMATLRSLIGDTDHFVLTCNLDARFARAGFDEGHVLETEGTVSKLVCSAGCCDERHPAEEAVRVLDASTARGRVDPTLIPVCPHCGALLVPAIDEMRLRHPDSACRELLTRFERLVTAHRGQDIVVLELGVGLRNRVIKHLLAQAVADEPNLTYAIFNYDQVVFPRGLEGHCVGIDGDMAVAFAELGG